MTNSVKREGEILSVVAIIVIALLYCLLLSPLLKSCYEGRTTSNTSSAATASIISAATPSSSQVLPTSNGLIADSITGDNNNHLSYFKNTVLPHHEGK